MFDWLHKWVSGSPTKYFPFIFSLSAFLLTKKKFQKNNLKVLKQVDQLARKNAEFISQSVVHDTINRNEQPS